MSSASPATFAGPSEPHHTFDGGEAPASCHGLLRPLPAGLDLNDLRARARSAAAQHPALRPLRLWVETLAGGAEDPLSETRRVRELRSAPSRSAPVRAVALAYGDEVSELVLVALRAYMSRAELAELATLLVDPGRPVTFTERGLPAPRPASREAVRPDWGLGDPRHAGRWGVVELPALQMIGSPLPMLLAATALALSRYEQTERPVVGFATDELLGASAATVAAESHRTAAELLAAAAAAAETAASPADFEMPSVGILLTRRDGIDRYEPGLAPMFPLTLCCEVEADSRVHAVCRFDPGSIDGAVASRFGHQVSRLVGLLAAGASPGAIGELDLLDDREREEILLMGRTPPPDVPPTTTIDEGFSAVARTQPDAPAISEGGCTLTYRQLDARGDVIAARLREHGVGAGARVGVCLENGLELVATLLGVLRAGAAYVPIDPRYPAQRMRYMLDDAGVAVMVTDLAEFPATTGLRPLRPRELMGGAASAPEAVGASAEDAAYVIYTSGSTGRPKGVVVRHRNVTALLAATARDMSLGPQDVWTGFHSSAFDFSVWEIWGCLLTGGHLIAVPYELSRAPDEFHDLLVQRGVTVLNQTPSAFAQLLEVERRRSVASFPRLVVFGGEPLDVTMLDAWLSRHPGCRLVNMFGITETTVHVTTHTITARDIAYRSRSVGHALPGWSVSVRDPHGRVLPIGAPGEIYVGGAGVASHYLNLEELTAQRFIIDPVTGERLYRSGDRGRLRPDGAIDHLGRLDSQVKLRGHRIEPGEIRQVLQEDAAVSAAAVVLGGTEHHDPARLRLDAYVVLADGGAPDDLRRRLRQMLPDYMMPSTITAVPALPLTVNGKLDVARLPAPQLATDVASVKADNGQVAGKVLSAWRLVLGPQAGGDDDFFELGGNSLIAVRLAAALRDADLPRVSLRDLYLHPTPNRLAASLLASPQSEASS